MSTTATFITAGFGAIVGASAALIFGLFRARLDAQNTQNERLCSTILEAAGLAAEYWLTERPQSGEVSGKPDVGSRLSILEAALMGYQAQILLMFENLEGEFPVKLRDKLRAMQPNLIDALTGGNFMNGIGDCDGARALIAQDVAAQISVAIRSNAAHIYTIRYIIGRIFRKSLKNMTKPAIPSTSEQP